MKYTLSLLAIVALAATVPAHAAVISADFTGIVSSTQGATGESVGNTVMGNFDLDNSTGNFIDFTIAGRSVAPGYQSFANIGPAFTDAIYTAQVSSLVTGGSINSTFSLDLSSLTNWPPSETAFSLLTDESQLNSNLDTINNSASAFPSTFTFYTANANGTNVVSLTANLTSITATATPEPASFALVASSLLAAGLFVRRRA